MPMLVSISKSLQNTLEKLSRETGEPISHLISSALAHCFDVPQHTLFQVSNIGGSCPGDLRAGCVEQFLTQLRRLRTWNLREP